MSSNLPKSSVNTAPKLRHQKIKKTSNYDGDFLDLKGFVSFIRKYSVCPQLYLLKFLTYCSI